MGNNEYQSVLLFNGKVVVAEEGHVFELTQINVNRSPKVQYLVSGELMTLFIIEHEARYGYLDMGLRGIFYTGKDDGKINTNLFKKLNDLCSNNVSYERELSRKRIEVNRLCEENEALKKKIKNLEEGIEELSEKLKKEQQKVKKLTEKLNSKISFWQRLFNRKKYML